jgi:hypothetical protein
MGELAQPDRDDRADGQREPRLVGVELRVTLRSLAEIETHMLNAASAFNRIREQYQWAVNYALTPTKANGQGSGQIAYSDPAGGVVADEHKGEVRDLLEEFADAAQRADTDLTRIRKALDKRLGPEDPKKPRGTFPRSVGKTELDRLKEARDRRRIRSEHYGN